MSGMIFGIDVTKFFNKVGRMVNVDVAAGATRVIDFYSEFNGIAKSILIDNRDGVNVATYRLHSRGALQRTVRAATSRSISDTPVELIEVIAGVGDVVQISAEVVPIKDLL